MFGLASFTATKRFKEIGVRKVLGSSVQGIVVLLSKDLLKPVLIAACIALPVGYWAMNKWLQNFAYKTSLSWWIFLFGCADNFWYCVDNCKHKSIQSSYYKPGEEFEIGINQFLLEHKIIKLNFLTVF